MRRCYSSGALAALLLSSTLVVSAAAVPLATPTITPVVTSRTSAILEVQAGDSGAPDGFTLEWMTAAQFDAEGGWSPSASRGNFFGTPTLNDVDGSDFRLLPVESAGLEIGDLFDETGLTSNLFSRTELLPDVEYVVRARANGNLTTGADASDWSAAVRVRTQGTTSQNCTYTQGYWKNHTSVWPVSSLTLGTVTYSAAQLLSIFNQPAAGNGLISLAHQLIAAKLNIAQGAVPTPAVSAAIASADAAIGTRVVPPVGSGSLSPGSTSGLTNTLDQFNNGLTGPGHCGTVRVGSPTWGGLKIIYRGR